MSSTLDRVVGPGRFGTSRDGYAAMKKYAKLWPNRVWAIEGCQRRPGRLPRLAGTSRPEQRTLRQEVGSPATRPQATDTLGWTRRDKVGRYELLDKNEPW